MTWYCDREIYWLCHPSIEWSLKKYKINVPDNCDYIKNKNQKYMYLPLLKFTNGTTDSIYSVAVTRSFELKKI
jgi:hypothetical protein